MKVSVLMSNYNRDSLMLEAVNCLKAQTLTDWELIIYDDASDKASVHALYDDFISDFRIKVIKRAVRENNIARAWNVSLDASHGEYVVTLDTDELRVPEWLAKATAWLDSHPDYDAVCYGSEHNRPDGTRFNNALPILSMEIMQIGNTIGSGEIMFRRRAFDVCGYWREDISWAEDWEFNRRVMARCKIGQISEYLSYCRRVDNHRMLQYEELRRDEMERRIRSANPSYIPQVGVKNTPNQDLIERVIKLEHFKFNTDPSKCDVMLDAREAYPDLNKHIHGVIANRK
jgi:glycosyltransferase involved in cell wall biosynthesis